jgi:hypothetical protein
MAPKWKYQKPKKVASGDAYIHFMPEETKVMKISDWNFDKNPYNDSLFSTAVREENGITVDKVWSVWDYDLKENLRKSLRKFNGRKDSVVVKITRHSADEEDSFDYELIQTPSP